VAYILFWYSHVKNLTRSESRLGLATLFALFTGSFFVNALFYPMILVWVWAILGTQEKRDY